MCHVCNPLPGRRLLPGLNISSLVSTHLRRKYSKKYLTYFAKVRALLLQNKWYIFFEHFFRRWVLLRKWGRAFHGNVWLSPPHAPKRFMPSLQTFLIDGADQSSEDILTHAQADLLSSFLVLKFVLLDATLILFLFELCNAQEKQPKAIHLFLSSYCFKLQHWI